MTPREELDLLRKRKRLAELEAKATGTTSPKSPQMALESPQSPETESLGSKALKGGLKAVASSLPVVGPVIGATELAPALGAGLDVASRGGRALGVGIQRKIEGDPLSQAVSRGKAAFKPEFEPKEGENIGAIAGEIAPLLAVPGGVVGGAAATGLQQFGRAQAEGASLPEAAGRGVAAGAASLGLGAAGQKLTKAGVGLAKRVLAFSKPTLKRLGARANDVAERVLKLGLLDNAGDDVATLANVKDAGKAIGGQIGSILDNTPVQIAPSQVVSNIVTKLKPKVSGPLAQAQLNALRDINETVVKTLQEPGANPLRALQSVRSELAEKASFTKTGTAADKELAELYTKAYGILTEEIDNAVARSAVSDTLMTYKEAAKNYSAIAEARRALEDKLAGAEASSQRASIFSPTELLRVAGRRVEGALANVAASPVVKGPANVIKSGARAVNPLITALVGEPKRKEKK